MAEFDVFDERGNLVPPQDDEALKPTTTPEVLGAFIGHVAARVRDRLPTIGLVTAIAATSVALAAGAQPQEQPNSAGSPGSTSSK